MHERKQTLWSLTQGQRLRYTAAIAAMGIGILFAFGVPLVFRSVLDEVLREGGGDATWLHAVAEALTGQSSVSNVMWLAFSAVVLLTSLGSVFQYLRGRWAAVAAEAIVRRLRDHLYSHLERLPLSYFDRADTGDLVQRCSSDVETLRVFLAAQVVEIGRALLLLAIVMPILFSLDYRMALLSMALFPIIIGFALVFFRRVRDVFRQCDEAEAAVTTVLQENLTGIRVVRAFARQEFERQKFAEKNAEFRDRSQHLMEVLSNYWSISDFICMSQIGIVLLSGAWFLSRGEIGVGTMFAFFTYEAMVLWPLRHMGRVLSEASKATVAFSRLREILDEAEESRMDEDLGSLSTQELIPRLSGSISVKGLSFAFAGERVLHDVSFAIQAGDTLALIGPPGSGKSCLVQVLLALYDYEHGSIKLDGRELSRLPRQFVRRQIGAALQEPFLYSRTVRENLLVGAPHASQASVEAAAAAACVHDNIAGFENGYDTLVGERGVTLSGGQRQRVAIARALLEDTPILILDDALSAVDTQTEKEILAALQRRRGRQTTIIVAHRMSTIAHADRICVFERGRIVQSGSHPELIAIDGPYRRLWEFQGDLDEELSRDLAREKEVRK